MAVFPGMATTTFMTKRLRIAAALVGAALAVVAWLTLAGGAKLPPELAGAIVFVSDRDGTPALYWRRLPRNRERRLSFGSEPASEPAVSPDGTRVAFSMNGRIGVVAVASGDTQVLTLGVDWRDAQPAWLRDGRRLVVSARRRVGEPASLHLLESAADGSVARHPLTQSRAGDDLSPAPSPDGGFVVFVREERLMRVELGDGRVARLSGGFKRDRSPRFLGEGRLVCAWSEGKKHGIDAIDLATKTRATLTEGGVFYRTIAPSPDGRFLAVTRSWDAGLDPLAVLFGGQREEVHLLDADGRELARLEAGRRQANHSPDWGR
jgi:Tol biopolymer transport system component